jgi:hypothetical protein
MMGFFEYEMASYFLKRHAAPTEPVLKTDPSRSHAGSSGPARAPAGSI